MSTDIKEAVAASIVVQDERPISYKRQWQTLMKEQSQAGLIYQLVSFDTTIGYLDQVAHREHTYERMVPRYPHRLCTTKK